MNTAARTKKTSDFELLLLVNEGWRLNLQIKRLKNRMEKIKKVLRNEGRIRPDEHIPLATRPEGGSQWVFHGSNSECHVVFPQRKLSGTIDPRGPYFPQVLRAAGSHFDMLFSTLTVVAPRRPQTFRQSVNNVLSSQDAAQLLELCTKESEPRITWSAKESAFSREEK